MKVDDFNDVPTNYDPDSDELQTADIMDTRKDRLTLRDLNRLKKLRAFRKLEMLKRQDTLSTIYGQPEAEE